MGISPDTFNVVELSQVNTWAALLQALYSNDKERVFPVKILRNNNITVSILKDEIKKKNAHLNHIVASDLDLFQVR